ncbi:MAG: glutamate-5-semialdehyde dehydrogenase, partial [Thermodesulfobacteriota bacterium]|nr:glutamate-5-semialdehyde dehydrogenase [Thermodesulfobacteriota bacterium]
MEIRQTITTIGKRVKEASKLMATLPTTEKNDVIMEIGEEIIKNRDLLEMENKKDLKEASSKGLSSAMIDRLTLSNSVIDAMVEGLCDVAKLPDPVGEVTGMWRRPNGLLVGRMRIPLGVVGIIYESRPNVTIDASSLCLKSGNGVLLRGGSEALHSNIALTKMVQSVLERHGIPQDACQIIPTTNREAIYEMILMEDYIDVIIPRGGDSLIRFIVENSKIPVIKHYKGICHTFIDESADKEMAEKIVINAKVQRPGVCNSLETLLVHKNIAASFLPTMIQKLHAHGVEIRGCEKVQTVVPEVKSASEEDWDAEYLDLILAVKVVDG